MFRKDRDRFGGGFMFYVNEQISSKVLSLESIPMDIELTLLEFTVKNQRWLCVGVYRPPSPNEKYFIDHWSTLGHLSCMLIGDFNLNDRILHDHIWSGMFDKETNLFPVFKSNLRRSYFNKQEF